MVDIFREQKDSEKKLTEGGFKDIRRWRKTDIMQLALAKIDKVDYDCLHKKRIPYCTKCARNLIERKIAEINETLKRRRRDDESDVKIDFEIDYEQFGGEANFTRVDDSEVMETMNVNNIRTQQQTGIWKNYVCKKCGSNVSMQFKNEEIEKEKEKEVETYTPKKDVGTKKQ